ncbi:hypothetical protein GCM10022268_28220 [Sphingomonas cynarae]|uniref:Tetratricopeptide repeat protein n=1 Tax=Sphingomonas cynarae TaxID=930197 RepID=A0ABP7EEW8_9SPHN
MRSGTALTAMAFVLAAGVGGLDGARAQAAVERVVVPSIASLLATPHVDEAMVRSLYRRATVQGTAAAVDAQLLAAAGRTDAPPARRARACIVRSLLAWQDGRIADADVAAQAAVTLAPGPETWLTHARLLDAMGRPARAALLFAQVAAATRDPEERTALRLRAAIAADDRDTAAIAALVAEATPRARRGIAELLNLLGKPADALAIYSRAAGGDTTFPAQLRMAQWAIAAGDRGAATTAAWAAYGAATTSADRRYALALLAEAYRNAGDLPGLLTFLGTRSGPDVVQLRLDTLVELGRFDDALTLVRGGGDPALRAQLPGLLDLAGRRDALIAEYDRLMAREPAVLRWYDALAVLHLSVGEREQALAVFRRLFATNPRDPGLLTDAARRMIAMGLTAPALEMIGRSEAGRAGGDPARANAIRFFQFESEMTQGRTDAAIAVLADLDRGLPRSDPQRIAVADGYERLGREADALRVLAALEAAGFPLDFDEQVHVARLERGQGKGEAALARLRGLWLKTSLPAQRSFLEMQILADARKLERLDGLAQEVQAAVAAGDDRGVELLVALRLARNDRAGARRAVDAFAAAPGSARPDALKRLAALNQRLGDSDRYRATLTRLVAVDPAHAETYLQQLVRDVAGRPARGTRPTVSTAELDTLLARLNAVRAGRSGGGQAEARRFSAGVYAIAGQTDRAIALYREAVAAAPADQDATLGLVNLLNANGRRAQAIAMLQYRAEFATTPQDQAQALEALAGILAATSGGAEPEQSPQYAQTRLSWARRLLYWRLARSDGDGGLYDQLADVSEQIGDTRSQRRAREAALAVEGTQRAASLRQLIALASGAGEGGGAVVGDNDAKALYGRRLTALRQPYPADVYTELAAAMLVQHDLAGAARAFGLIEEIPGLVNVDALKGDAYRAAGYLPQALAGYSRGLLRDRGDKGLILKTAILQEQAGDPALAGSLYWTSLRDALMRLPPGRPADAAGQAAVVSPFDDSVLEGLLFVWPTETTARREIGETIERMTREAMTQTASWRDATRLRRLLDVARRLAASGRDLSVLAAIGPLLDARFAGDAAYLRDRAAFRNLTGEPRSQSTAATPAGDPDWIAGALNVQARDGENAELRLALAMERGDDAGLARLFADAAQQEIAIRRALTPTDYVYESPLNAMLMMAANGLSAAQLRGAVLAPLDAAGIREDALFDLLRTAPDRLATLERKAGGPLLSNERAMVLIRTRLSDPAPRRATLRRQGGKLANAMDGIVSRFSPDEQVTLYTGLVEDQQRTGRASVLSPMLEQRLLRQPLSADMQARMTVAIRKAMGADVLMLTLARQLFSLIDVPAANRPVVIAAARAFAERYPSEQAVPDAIEAEYRGDHAAALEALLRRYDAAPPEERSDFYVSSAVTGFLLQERRRQAEAFLADPDPTPEQRALFYRRYVQTGASVFGGTDADQRRYLERLVTLDPDNATYLAGLIRLLWNGGNRAGVAARLGGFVAAHPEERDAASVLQLVLLLAAQTDAATAVAKRSGVDVNDPDYLIDLLARVQAGRDSGNILTFVSLFGAVYEAARQEKPTLEGIAALDARRHQDRTTVQPVDADLLAPMAREAANPARVPMAMRGVWRWSAADPNAPADTAAAQRETLLQRLIAVAGAPAPASGAAPATGDAAIVAALTGSPAIAAELDREARLLDPFVRQRQQSLYDLVAAGLVRQGLADQRIDALLAKLADGSIDGHDLHLLATLAVDRRRVLAPVQLAQIRIVVDRLPAMTPQRRIIWSRLFAAAGDYAGAQEWLEAAAMQILYVDAADLGSGAPLSTFDPVVDALRDWADKTAAAAAHAALAVRIERERAIMPADDVPAALPPLVPAA